MERTFAYVWEYHIREASRAEFEAVYGPDGEWQQLFRRDPAYLGTRLLRDQGHAARFLTIDYWRSRSDRDACRVRFATEFDQLDLRCAELTASEVPLGEFDSLAPLAARRSPDATSSQAN